MLLLLPPTLLFLLLLLLLLLLRFAEGSTQIGPAVRGLTKCFSPAFFFRAPLFFAMKKNRVLQ